ncbi:hypothetical protein P3X46_027789 [Hevea brasiliensis]|uniref:Uncharacterized protein n=1 Tax=Hevea brasiliensis TaxID=3981 RepID=A0ABQ9L223_HEVBR|nr:hypothetical protein P3X46_027789 [Hevea brasiliensis]
MGCGESKHAVATGNTITRKKSDAASRKSEVIKTVDETREKGNKTDSLVRQEGSQNLGDENVVPVANEYKESKGEKEMNKEDGVAVEDQEPAGRLISKGSPNRSFSSRKFKDVEGFTSEGRSDESEYSSPRLGSEKDSFFSDCSKSDDIVEETLSLVQATENGLETLQYGSAQCQ